MVARTALLSMPILLAAVGYAFAAEKGGGPTTEDIEQICEAQFNVCMASCQRPDTPSGVLQASFCRQDCYGTYAKCPGTPARVQKNGGGTGLPIRGTAGGSAVGQ
jgi:hypothetical protein